MKLVYKYILLNLIFIVTNKVNTQNHSSVNYLDFKIYLKDTISVKEYGESSPSFTKDGLTMVFARYKKWGNKTPYIANKQNGKWYVKKFSATDSVYNISISPKGNRVIYQKYVTIKDNKKSKVYVVDKKDGQWGIPREVVKLRNMDAGYFQIHESDKLYFFARTDDKRTGIYYAFPDSKSIYGKPQWLSDNVSPSGVNSYGILMNLKENGLIITRGRVPKDKEQILGPKGFYYYKKVNNEWIQQKRLPLPYGWGASVNVNDKFVFVYKGDLQSLPIEALNIESKWL